jgi:hypothetical protein
MLAGASHAATCSPGLTRHKISYRARERAWLQVEGSSYAKRGNRTGRG